MPAERPNASADQPTAYVARAVATGLATAAGAALTSLVNSRGTLVGAILVAMTVSVLGQVMRVPLDRLQRRLMRLAVVDGRGRPYPAAVDHVVPGPTASRRTRGNGGVVRSILLIGLVGFLVGMGTISAREIAQARVLGARLVRTPHSGPIQAVARPAPTPPDIADEDANVTPEPPASRHSSPPAEGSAPKPTPSRPTSPTPPDAVTSGADSQNSTDTDPVDLPPETASMCAGPGGQCRAASAGGRGQPPTAVTNDAPPVLIGS